jgi:hypothetical protein
MDEKIFASLFADEVLRDIFPPSRSDLFFEALYGDAAEGAYTIILKYHGFDPKQDLLRFEWELHRLPGKCLACSLTYGLPQVFTRHPVIDLKGLIRKLEGRLGDGLRFGSWRLGRTREISDDLHTIPLTIQLERIEKG